MKRCLAILFLGLPACAGSVTQGTTVSSRSDATDARGNDGSASVDATFDTRVLDVSMDALDASGDTSPIEDAGRYEPPAEDASHFDGCASNACGDADLCLDQRNYLGDPWYSACDSLPASCGPNPTCLCIAQAAYWWCLQPKCEFTDGGIVLTCSDSAPP